MSIVIRQTKRFMVLDVDGKNTHDVSGSPWMILCNFNCSYTHKIVLKCIEKRKTCCSQIFSLENGLSKSPKCKILQFCDFEHIDWEVAMSGQNGQCLNIFMASSYLIRKGLSRKAQLSLQLKKYFSKNKSIYKECFPFTVIVETWNAFEEMKIDFSPGVFAAFDSSHFANTSLRQRLEWILDDTSYEYHKPEREDWLWILKPSVTNKAIDIAMIKSWDCLIDALESVPDMREWVLQKYIANPFLLGGPKASHPYNIDDLDNIYSHLTNTACNAQQPDFDEANYVKTLQDLPAILHRDHPNKYNTLSLAEEAVNQNILPQIYGITKELFTAYENEYTIFAPLNNCFELYGLDFLVDENLGLHFLEVNPGPDFKQTGDRLKQVIEDLFEQTFQLIIDQNILCGNDMNSNDKTNTNNNMSYEKVNTSTSNNSPSEINKAVNTSTSVIAETKDFKLIYDKEWSVSKMTSGFSFH